MNPEQNSQNLLTNLIYLVCGVLLVLFVGAPSTYFALLYNQLDPEQAQNTVAIMTPVVGLFGGVALLINAYYAAKRAMAVEKNAIAAERNIEVGLKNAELAEERLISERFSKAIELLSNQETSSRIGSIYALEQIAKELPERYQKTVIEILVGFIRYRAVPPENTERSEEVQAAINVIRRRDIARDDSSQRIDLSGKFFGGINLSFICLKKSLFRKSDLTNANLQGAILNDADFTEANLREANLIGANLTSANLRLASLHKTLIDKQPQIDRKWHLVWQIVNLNPDSWQIEDLKELDLSWADLSGANLRGTDLRGTDLSRANLSRADLSMAKLGGANLSEANLCGANLSGAQRLEANLSGANLSGADLSGADLSRANLSKANLNDANLKGAKLSDGITSASVKNAYFTADASEISEVIKRNLIEKGAIFEDSPKQDF